MGRLEGKVAVITGAANGMGKVAAERFATEGASIVVADLDGAACAAVADSIVQAGGSAIGIELDVTVPAQIEAAVTATVDRFGRLDVLYNNAGVSLPDDDNPENTPIATIERTFAVNVTGLLQCCGVAIPAMRAGGGGSIINVASFVAHMGAATPQIAYTASKGAVLSATREIAAIYARDGIRANALCPGPVLTPLLAKYMADDDARQRRLVHIPMGRFGQADEMVNGAVFLASDESSFMTGASLLLDGGITATYTTPL